MDEELRPSKDYIDWLSKNRDKRGTPEYQTVANAAIAAYKLEQGASPLSRFTKGLLDPTAGLMQLVPKAAEFVTSGAGYFPNVISETIGKGGDLFDRKLAREEAEYQQGRKLRGIEPESADVLRGFGAVVNPATLGAARVIPAAKTVVGKIATGATGGGFAGLSQPVVTPEEQQDFGTQKLTQTAIGTATGAVLNPTLGTVLEKVGPKVVNFLARKGPQFASLLRGQQGPGAQFNYKFYAQKAVDEALDELKIEPTTLGTSQYQGLINQVENSLRTGQPLSPGALIRQSDYERLGIQPTLGQLSRDPRQYATEQNLAQVSGIGEPLLERLSQQATTMRSRLGAFAENAEDERIASVVLGTNLRNFDEALRSRVSALYSQARQSTGRNAEIPVGGFAADLGKIMKDYRGQIPAGIVARLNEYGFLGPQQTKVFDFGEADDLIRLINDNFGASPATDSALKAIRKAVQTAIEKAPVPDEFAAARLAASQRFKLQEKLPILEEAVTNRGNDEQLISKYIFRGTAKDVNELAKFLQQNSPELYQQMKAQIGQYLQRSAFGEDLSGDKLIRPEAFAKAIRQLGGREKLKAFFTEEELLDLEALARVAAYSVSPPAKAPVNYSGSGAAMFNLLKDMPAVGENVTFAERLFRPFVQQRNVNVALQARPPAIPQPGSNAARRAAILATMGTAGAVAPRGPTTR